MIFLEKTEIVLRNTGRVEVYVGKVKIALYVKVFLRGCRDILSVLYYVGNSMLFISKFLSDGVKKGFGLACVV